MNGVACAAANECVSGACADGLCCDGACSDACEACNLVGSEGTCSAVPAGSTGAPSCSPYLCDGANSSCPIACTVDTDCSTGFWCNAGMCSAQKANGIGCAGGNECLSAVCADGVCCDGACSGACDACNLVGTEGTCSAVSQGQLGDPSCSPYVCDGSAVACPASCAADVDCASGHYCDGTACLPQLAPGVACSAANQCLSGFCVEGLCCDTACGGDDASDCQACAAALTGAADGTCAPVSSGTECRAAAGDCDAAEMCDGAGVACPADALVPGGTECRAAAGACDVAEACDGAAVACPADAVAADGASCDDGDVCTEGDACERGACTPGGDVCGTGGAGGSVVSGEGGVGGSSAGGGTQGPAELSTEADGGCACRVTKMPSRSGGFVWVGLVGLVALRRRARAQKGQRAVASPR